MPTDPLASSSLPVAASPAATTAAAFSAAFSALRSQDAGGMGRCRLPSRSLSLWPPQLGSRNCLLTQAGVEIARPSFLLSYRFVAYDAEWKEN